MTARIAIGVMARAPVPGRCKTRLGAAIGEARAVALYRAMLDDTLSAYERTGASRLVVMAAPEDDGVAGLRAIVPRRWDVLPQDGPDLGTRLDGAFRALGADGAAVALVSSDSPTVDPAPIARAFLAPWHDRRAIIGPCDDGGYYLVAMARYDPAILRGIPWSTSRVAAETRARCREAGIALEELPGTFDVDDARDLERLRAELRADPRKAPRCAAALELA